MPELIPQGPDIPEEALNALRDNQLVLFCGAGTSTATGLPDFFNLVKSTYGELGLSAEFEELKDQHIPLDKLLWQLEKQLPGPAVMREKVVEILSKGVPKGESLDVHKALLDLSRIDLGKYRLITTNFDNRFDEAAKMLGVNPDIKIAPSLPVPNKKERESLAYLHGKITDRDKTGTSLILTSVDFGQAYLTDRWASRFVTELLRNFHILFVGYSVGDPVLDYLLQAAEAERGKNAEHGGTWAFVSYADGKKEDAAANWKFKRALPHFVWRVIF